MRDALDGIETSLSADDAVSQRETRHAWINRTDSTTRGTFVLAGAIFTEELRRHLSDEFDIPFPSKEARH